MPDKSETSIMLSEGDRVKVLMAAAIDGLSEGEVGVVEFVGKDALTVYLKFPDHPQLKHKGPFYFAREWVEWVRPTIG